MSIMKNKLTVRQPERGCKKLVDIDLLKTYIKDSGVTMMALSSKTGMNRATLYTRLSGARDFTASEIMSISEALKMTKKERDDIFFSQKVE